MRSVAEIEALLVTQTPQQREAIRQAADAARQETVGDTVTYVINRNINFTNICEQHCRFCAFRRDADQAGAYWLDEAAILSKVAEAVAAGATEICMQGGLNPAATLNGSTLAYYCRLAEAIKTAYPALHLHAFSPQEIAFIARNDQVSLREVLLAVRAAGVGSLPGTAAEILVPQVRRQLCPEKLTTAEWIEVVATAHSIGFATTATMLSGHIETMADRAAHWAVLRDLQLRARAAGQVGFTEFILLPYVGALAPESLRKQVGRDQPDPDDALLTMAVARLYLGDLIPNHQPSWVKLGLAVASEALRWGCNDIGGTLMEEHITSMAGAVGGTCQSVEALQRAIAAQGRPYRERTTLYESVTVNSVTSSVL